MGEQKQDPAGRDTLVDGREEISRRPVHPLDVLQNDYLGAHLRGVEQETPERPEKLAASAIAGPCSARSRLQDPRRAGYRR